MLKINTDIILRDAPDGAYLFNPDNGKLFRLNRSGSFLWQCVAKGMTVSEIVARIRELPGVPESPEEVVETFLMRLAEKHFISGYKESIPSPPPLTQKEPENYALYEMNSMFRVFSSGDALLLKAIPFDQIEPGDVVAFQLAGPDAPGVVHRVIARQADFLITQGENNPKPDSHRVTVADFPRLVVAKISPDNQRTAISHGAAGMRQFRRNRIRRAFRKLLGRLFRLLRPWMFWQIELRENINGEYYYHRRLIAERHENVVHFLSFWYLLRFRLTDGTLADRQK